VSWIKKLLAKFFAWTVKDLWAKAVKATGGFLSAAVFAWLLGIYAQLSNSEFPTSVEGAWQLIARAPSALIVAINNHPYHAGSYAFLIALSLAFVCCGERIGSCIQLKNCLPTELLIVS
jgi:hypothetical protein